MTLWEAEPLNSPEDKEGGGKAGGEPLVGRRKEKENLKQWTG